MTKWCFGSKLLMVMTHYNIPYTIHAAGSFTDERLGSSPGNIYWDGRRFHIEDEAPVWIVAHDIAHWLVQRIETPSKFHRKNFGFTEAFANDHETNLEIKAAEVTISLLARLNLPWKEAALEMSMPQNMISTSEVRFRDEYSRTDMAKVKDMCNHTAQKYLADFPV